MHAGFPGSAVALLNVALKAGCNDVVPGVAASTRAGYDVVDREIVPAIATVLTSVAIAMQDIAPREADLFIWNLDVGP